MENRNIIIILLVVIVALMIAIGATLTQSFTAKEPTKLVIVANATLEEGDSIAVKLTDANNSPLANQTVNITVTDSMKTSSYYSVLTNANGVGKMKLDKGAGKYNVTAAYAGNEKYDSNSSLKILTVKQKVAQAQASSQSSSALPYSIDNLPASNDPNPETNRYQIDQYHVRQEYSDNYFSIVDLRTGERHGGFF